MTCTPLRFAIKGGGVAVGFACGPRTRRRRCKCGALGEPKLCDFDIGAGKTCDAECCSTCAAHVGADRDFCPKHKETTTMTTTNPAQRYGLPPEVRTRIGNMLKLIAVEVRACKACQRTIYICVTTNGKRAPFTDDGVSHFSDCPQASQFKKGGP